MSFLSTTTDSTNAYARFGQGVETSTSVHLLNVESASNLVFGGKVGWQFNNKLDVVFSVLLNNTIDNAQVENPDSSTLPEGTLAAVGGIRMPLLPQYNDFIQVDSATNGFDVNVHMYTLTVVHSYKPASP